jgi:hypothetical protein
MIELSPTFVTLLFAALIIIAQLKRSKIFGYDASARVGQRCCALEPPAQPSRVRVRRASEGEQTGAEPL